LVQSPAPFRATLSWEAVNPSGLHPDDAEMESKMFNAWKQEKATAALVDEAQALADKLADAKSHIVDSYAAYAQVWAATYRADGKDLHDLSNWPPATVSRFATAAQSKIAALRKSRDYDSSDGLTIWLHTARAVTEARIAPAVREIWDHILAAGPNADTMAQDLMEEAGLPVDTRRRAPAGFGTDDASPGAA
jgi:hypothetical protein